MGEGSEPFNSEPDDLSWGEFSKLSLAYLRIPLALLVVELFYWFITQPTNTLGFIQESEAWIWYHLTELIYGSGSASLSEYNGWTTLVTLRHENFYYDQVRLYVSDECAGVHEMLFISVLIMMTSGVPQRLRIKSAIVACGIVYVLNIVRLVVLYPLAIDGCNENPNMLGCEQPMHDFHTFVYEWGFLIILVIMWLIWFKWVNGGDRIKQEQLASENKWRFIYRKKWEPLQKTAMICSILLILFAVTGVLIDDDAMKAKETKDICEGLISDPAACGDANDRWAQEIQTAWSLATLGLLGIAVTVVSIETKQDNFKSSKYEEG